VERTGELQTHSPSTTIPTARDAGDFASILDEPIAKTRPPSKAVVNRRDAPIFRVPRDPRCIASVGASTRPPRLDRGHAEAIFRAVRVLIRNAAVDGESPAATRRHEAGR